MGRRCSLCQPFHFLPCCLSAPLTHLSASFSGTLELKATKDSAHKDFIRSVAFSPDGSKIVSGSDDKTIKVWDAGARFRQLPCRLSSPLTPFLLASQILWNSRQPKRAPTAVALGPSPSLRTARRSSRDPPTRRSKCGTQVSRFTFCHLVFLRF